MQWNQVETQVQGTTIRLRGDDGVKVSVSVVDEGIVRVCIGGERNGPLLVNAGREGDPQFHRASDTGLKDGRFTTPFFKVNSTETACEIATNSLKCSISTQNRILMHFIDSDGNVLLEDVPSLGYQQSSTSISHYTRRNRSDKYYGLGEPSGNLNLHHRRFRLKCTDSMGYDAEHSDPLYKHIPFYISLVDTGYENESTEHGRYRAFGLLYDTYAEAEFDFGKELNNYHGLYKYCTIQSKQLDYYFIHGPSIAQVTQRMCMLTGFPILPPLWSLGYLGSSMVYTDSPDPTKSLGIFVRDCELNDIPLSGFHLSSGYSAYPDQDMKRYVFQWDYNRIPNPKQLVTQFTNKGVHVIANIKPALLETHPLFPEVVRNGLCILNNQGNVYLGDFWGGSACFLDFTKFEAREWWKKQVKEHILSHGIEITWNDNNEFEAVGDAITSLGPAKHLRPLLTFLMLRTSFEAQQEFNTHLRPFVLSRSGGAGMQKFGQTWSGDNFTEWKTIRFNNAMSLNLGLCGVVNNGHDVGGFAGSKPSPELFLRWIQNGIFHPRFTVHSWNDDNSVTELWMYPQILPYIQQALEFRYRMRPYLYTLFEESSRTGHPISRPMCFQFQQDSRCHEEFDTFMVGESIIVPTISSESDESANVYFPIESRFIDLHNCLYGKDKTVYYSYIANVKCPLYQGFTCFAKTQSIIPLLSPDEIFIELHVFADILDQVGSTWSQVVYFDDGISTKYKDDDEFSNLNATVAKTSDKFYSVKFSFDPSQYAIFQPVIWYMHPRELFGSECLQSPVGEVHYVPILPSM